MAAGDEQVRKRLSKPSSSSFLCQNPTSTANLAAGRTAGVVQEHPMCCSCQRFRIGKEVFFYSSLSCAEQKGNTGF